MTTPDDDDLPSELEVWAQAVERRETAAARARADAPLPEDLLAWGRRVEYREMTDLRDALRAEVARYDPVQKELNRMMMTDHQDEAAALAELIDAATTPGATPPREAVTALALAVASPWAGERLLVRDRPRRPAPDAARFAEFIDRHLPPAPAAALPTDRGPLAFAAHHRLMTPLTKVRKAPAWALDPALRGGYLARPPRLPTLDGDGRLLALGMLVDAIVPGRRADPAVRLATTTLVEWFAGPRAPIPQAGLALECPELAWPNRHQWSWVEAFRDACEPGAVVDGTKVRGVVAAVMNLGRTVPATWTPPPPTAEQQQQAAIRADNARRRALAERMAAAGA